MTELNQDALEKFSIPLNIRYLNCAYLAPLMKSVQHAGEEGIRAKTEPWKVGSEQFFGVTEKVRAEFAKLVGASSDHIALHPAVSYAIATAAKNAPKQAGGEILLLDQQFPSNVYSWMNVARDSAMSLRFVKRREGQSWTEAVLDGLNSKVRIVALPPCHWSDGSLLDLKTIGEKVRALGVFFVVDASQWVGAQPFDVREIQPDFMTTVGYKWLLGPYGTALTYVAEKHWTGSPLEESWLNRAGSERFENLVNYRDDYQNGARRFDVGQREVFVLWPMALAALRQVNDWGVANISAYLSVLTEELAERAGELGFSVDPKAHRSNHMIGLRAKTALPADFLSRLKARDFFISQRGNALRVSPHLYNDLGQIALFSETLKKILGAS